MAMLCAESCHAARCMDEWMASSPAGDPEAVTAAQATLREMGSQLGAGLTFDVSTNPDQSGARSSLVVAGQLMSTAALQMAGFNNAADTEDCVVGWLKQMQAERYLPC
jgi:hypothetical protein